MELSVSTITAIAIVLYLAVAWTRNQHKSANAPGIGYGALPLLGPWQGVFTFMRDPEATIAKGLARYKGSYFRVATHATEYTIVADKKKVAEYLAAPDDILDFHASVEEILQIEWTLGYGVATRPYHIPLVRTKLTQTIASNVPSMLFEIQEVVNSLFGSHKDWTEFKLYNSMIRVVARVSNNAFSGGGLEFCRNEEYLELAIYYAQSVVMTAEILRVFPTWMKPFIARISSFRRTQKKARQIMGPYVQQRLEANWEGKEKPKDMIQFLIDGAPDVERTMPQIVERMMTLNMASIHTTTLATYTAICNLAREPEKYVPELRAELMEHCGDGKVDKQSLGRLVKLDSFLRECGRIQPPGIISSPRYARKDFTFTDGMVIPAGNTVAAPIMMLHNEPSIVEDGEEFDGFRYSRMNEESTGPTKHQIVNTDLNFLLFGHGKHACPGRFLAATEMKLILATMILEYDLKYIPGTSPRTLWFGTARIPDTNFPILVKARDSKVNG